MSCRITSRRARVLRDIGTGMLACALAAITAAQAQPRRPDPPGRGPGWHGNIERFQEHDWQVRRGGRWYHGQHGGRVGWWWIVGGVWYFYPAPVYPYPSPWEPPPPAAVPAVPPPTQHWYYCESAKGYYPYVPTCPDGWKQVPATPPK